MPLEERIVKGLVRLSITAIAAVASFYFVFWLPCSLIFPSGAPLWLPFLASATCSAITARYVWRRTATVSQNLVSSVVLGALMIGTISFCAGFFGPLVFAPDANQGPLLGIFITGPLGLVAGALAGAVHWSMRRARERRN